VTSELRGWPALERLSVINSRVDQPHV